MSASNQSKTRTRRPRDPRVEAVARWLSQNVISGTQRRDPDSEPWGASGIKTWQAWERVARGCLKVADKAEIANAR